MNDYLVESKTWRQVLLASSLILLGGVALGLTWYAPDAWRGLGIRGSSDIVAYIGVGLIELGKVITEITFIKLFYRLCRTKYYSGLIVVGSIFLLFLTGSVGGIYGYLSGNNLFGLFELAPFLVTMGIEILAFFMAALSVAKAPHSIAEDARLEEVRARDAAIIKQLDHEALRSDLNVL